MVGPRYLQSLDGPLVDPSIDFADGIGCGGLHLEATRPGGVVFEAVPYPKGDPQRVQAAAGAAGISQTPVWFGYEVGDLGHTGASSAVRQAVPGLPATMGPARVARARHREFGALRRLIRRDRRHPRRAPRERRAGLPQELGQPPTCGATGAGRRLGPRRTSCSTRTRDWICDEEIMKLINRDCLLHALPAVRPRLRGDRRRQDNYRSFEFTSWWAVQDLNL